MDNFMIAFIILLIAIFISRMINERANKKLDIEKKAALIDVFSKDRIWTYGILIGIVAIFFICLKFNLLDPFLTYVLYTIVLVIYIIIQGYYSYKKLKTNNFPDSYIRSYIVSSSIRLVALLVFMAILNS